MSNFVQAFEDRVREIEAYLDLLDAIEQEVQRGTPQLGKTGIAITVTQQRILYSSVYLQLYNLVESTVTRCLEAVTKAIAEKGSWQASDLSDKLRREWVRTMARTHTDLNFEHRLEYALKLCDQLVQATPIAEFIIEKGAGGSWDDYSINDITERIGFSLNISPEVKSKIKRPFRDERGSLAFIRSLRNSLAHGSRSFEECGEGITAGELRDLKDQTTLYLREVVTSFKLAIDSYEFLLPHRRPAP